MNHIDFHLVYLLAVSNIHKMVRDELGNWQLRQKIALFINNKTLFKNAQQISRRTAPQLLVLFFGNSACNTRHQMEQKVQ